jgi:PIN domain nuclease of toxin-antitoxin system
MKCVTYASAFLAHIFAEHGGMATEEYILQGVLITSVNWLEVINRLVRTGRTQAEAVAAISEQGLLLHYTLLSLIDAALLWARRCNCQL